MISLLFSPSHESQFIVSTDKSFSAPSLLLFNALTRFEMRRKRPHNPQEICRLKLVQAVLCSYVPGGYKVWGIDKFRTRPDVC